MRALIQRVKQANVSVAGQPVGAIEQGLLVFLGVAAEDTEACADKLIHKLLHYRVFADANDKMNLNVQQAKGDLLIVSQFTLMADTHKGLRPSFSLAAPPAMAQALYEYFIQQAQLHYPTATIASGIFAADMQVSLVNDGPVTFLLEQLNV